MTDLILRKAQKSKSKLRIGLSGTSGSGKTYSALLLSSGLADLTKVCVIDTENGSADLYDSIGDYNVITLTAPFSPERYIEAIDTAEKAGMEVIIIDSITHEWDGTGGCLEIVEQVAKASVSKNSYTAWAKVTPRHNAFVQKILQSNCHVITTVRRKQDYDMSKDQNGRTVISKVGMKEITREGFEYELTLTFSLSQNHLAEASKDRTGLFMDKPEFVITSSTGKTLKEWAEKGIVAPVLPVQQEEKKSDLPSTVNLASDKQIQLIAILLQKKGYTDSQLKTKYHIESKKELSKLQASEIIDNLNSLPDMEHVNPYEVKI